ncbi:hypothetical protein D3C81_200360 [compost metagenome]
MDIIQLLEVLKPAKDVLTVQIANKADPVTPWIDLAKGVLPAAATAFVAWTAMKRSHQQFEITSARQAVEFARSLEQQTKALKIQTQVATEVELKKNECRNIRDACAQFLSCAFEASRYNAEWELASKMRGNTPNSALDERMREANNKFLESFRKMMAYQFQIFTYLQLGENMAFRNSILKVMKLVNGERDEFDTSMHECLVECQKHLAVRQGEIVSLPATITGE